MSLSHFANSWMQVLEHLVYRPRKNFFGNDTVIIRLSDLGNYGPYLGHGDDIKLPLVDEAIIPIQVLPISDVPVVQGPSIIHVEEDTAEIINVYIEHVDSNTTDVLVSVKCSIGGKIELHSSLGLVLSNTSGTIVSGTGSVAAWNLALGQLLYTPARNWNTDNSDAEEIRFEVRNTADNDATETSSHVTFVNCKGSPDPPTWQVPGVTLLLEPTGEYKVESIATIEVPEDESITVSISLRDSDVLEDSPDIMFSVRISTSSGRIQLNRYNGIFLRNGSPGSNLLHFDATYTSINDAMEQLTYTPLPNFNGEDTITLFASDSSFNSTVEIPILVVPKPDIPVIRAPIILQCSKGKMCDFSGVSLEDPDTNPMLWVQMQTESGRLSFSADFKLSSRAVHLLNGSLSGDKQFTMTGSGNDLNSALKSLVYIPHPRTAPTIDLAIFKVKVMDDLIFFESQSEVQVFVTDTFEEPPFIRYDKILYHDDEACKSAFHLANDTDKMCKGHTQIEPIRCTEDQDCFFSGFSIDGDDSSIFEIDINVQHGALIFHDSLMGIQLMDIGDNVSVRGNIVHLNRALRHLIYKPTHHFVGKDTVNLHVSLSGEPTNGFRSTTHRLEVDVIIAGAFDRIRLVGPDQLHFVNEDEYISIEGIAATHVPSNNFANVQAIVRSTNGRFRPTKTNFSAVTIHDISDPNGRLWLPTNIMPHEQERELWWTHASICGNLVDVIKSLSAISFIAHENWNSEKGDYSEIAVGIQRLDTCEINPTTMDDRLEDSITVPIHVNPINDPPEINVETINHDNFSSEDRHTIRVDEDHEMTLPIEIMDIDNGIIKVDIKTNGLVKCRYLVIVDAPVMHISSKAMVVASSLKALRCRVLLRQ